MGIHLDYTWNVNTIEYRTQDGVLVGKATLAPHPVTHLRCYHVECEEGFKSIPSPWWLNSREAVNYFMLAMAEEAAITPREVVEGA